MKLNSIIILFIFMFCAINGQEIDYSIFDEDYYIYKSLNPDNLSKYGTKKVILKYRSDLINGRYEISKITFDKQYNIKRTNFLTIFNKPLATFFYWIGKPFYTHRRKIVEKNKLENKNEIQFKYSDGMKVIYRYDDSKKLVSATNELSGSRKRSNYFKKYAECLYNNAGKVEKQINVTIAQNMNPLDSLVFHYKYMDTLLNTVTVETFKQLDVDWELGYPASIDSTLDYYEKATYYINYVEGTSIIKSVDRESANNYDKDEYVIIKYINRKKRNNNTYYNKGSNIITPQSNAQPK